MVGEVVAVVGEVAVGAAVVAGEVAGVDEAAMHTDRATTQGSSELRSRHILVRGSHGACSFNCQTHAILPAGHLPAISAEQSYSGRSG
jgi:hypothetical protein